MLRVRVVRHLPREMRRHKLKTVRLKPIEYKEREALCLGAGKPVFTTFGGPHPAGHRSAVTLDPCGVESRARRKRQCAT